jgi:hypothetical protein
MLRKVVEFDILCREKLSLSRGNYKKYKTMIYTTYVIRFPLDTYLLFISLEYLREIPQLNDLHRAIATT